MIKALLIVVQGKPEGKTIPLVGPVFKVGRNADCHLRPSSDLISREHAEFTVNDEGVTLRDLGSRNGTILNGRNVTGTVTLKSGDLIQIGSLTFALAIQGAAPAKPTDGSPSAKPSLDEVPHDQIDSWLIADNVRPTPDRPSGVYDGDTLTLNAYNAGKSNPAAKVLAPDPAPAQPVAAAAAAPAPAPAAAPAVANTPPPKPKPAPVAANASAVSQKSIEEILESIEQLPEGAGDGEGDGGALASALGEDDAEGGEEANGSDSVEEEFLDPTNPFYAAKKGGAAAAEAAKPSYKDSSDAASAILRKMLERRRAGQS